MVKLVPILKNETRIEVILEIEFSRVPSFATGFVRAQISKSTAEGLDNIAREVEGLAEYR